MTAFLKALGYVGQSGLNKDISSRMGSERFHHPQVPGHSILVYRDKKTGKHKFMSTPATDHPKYKDGETQSFNTDFEAVRHGAGHMMERVPLKTAFKEAYVKKYRRKPLHRKIVRKRSIVKSRSVLRNGTELRSFSDFMTEGRYNDNGDIHACHDEDHRDGYKAGVEYHMGSGYEEENSHNQDTHPDCHKSWKEGFEQAGEDS